MKKQILFLMAGGALALASCGSEGGGYTQEQVDSMVNERVEALRLELEANNEARINELAQIKADSILAARAAGSSSTKKTSSSKPAATTPKQEETTPTVDPQKSRNNQNMTSEDQKKRNNQNTTADDQKKRNNQR
jgi:hypothetical protein